MDPELHAWLMARTGPGKQFKDLAHALDFAVATLKAAEERKEGKGSKADR
jgi:hypothetical protein